MSERRETRFYENGKAYDVLQGRYGLVYSFDSKIALLTIPNDVVIAAGGRDVLSRDLHMKHFDGAIALAGRNSDDKKSYIMEFLPNTEPERINAFMEEIADVYEESQKNDPNLFEKGETEVN